MASTATAQNATASGTTHPGVAMSTVTGMILGVMALFVLVVSYQLIPCLHRKQRVTHARHNIPVITPPRRGAKFAQAVRNFVDKCTTILKPLRPDPEPQDLHSLQHKSLRSLHLPTTQERQKRRVAREKFANQLRLNIPTSSDDLFTRLPSRRKEDYTQLQDSVITPFPLTEKPAMALMSPWSPREQDFPYPSTPTPTTSRWCTFEGGDGTPPPPFSPPPAYVPGTPLRSGGSPGFYRSPNRYGKVLLPPTAPTIPTPVHPVHRDDEDIDLRGVVVCTNEPVTPLEETTESIFVISDDMDSLSVRSSVSSTWSACTLEEPM